MLEILQLSLNCIHILPKIVSVVNWLD